MKKKWVIIIAAIVIVVVLLVGWGKAKAKKTMLPKNNYESVEVKKGEIVVKLEETGEIQPIKEIKIKSRISGKIIRMYVDEGDFVQKGQIICDIEPDFNQASQISSAQDRLKLAEISLAYARKELNNKEQLLSQHFISQDEYDKTSDNYKEEEISYKSALQQYNLVKELDTQGNISKVYAPAQGTVITKSIEEGEMVNGSYNSYSEGTVIMVLGDMQQMVVKASINEVDIVKIHLDQDVNVQINALPYDKFTGKITKIAAKAAAENSIKTFAIEILLSKADERLKPGMSANITIIGEIKKEILIVPIRTIFSDDNNHDIVYKVVKDSLSTAIPVRTGINDMQNVEIIEGLTQGDKVSLVEPQKDLSKIPLNFQ